jgi:hypothetical protein
MQLQANIFFLLERLWSITIPGSVRQIFNGAFCSCNNLRSVTFESPSQCRYIALGAFCDCNLLDSVFLPPSVRVIDSSTI